MESAPSSRQAPEALLILGRAYENLAELSLLEDRRMTDRLADSAVKYLKASLAKSETSAGYSALAHTYQVMTFAKKLNGPLLGPKMSQTIKRALELDPANFQALLLEAQGFLDPPAVFGGDIPKAIDILTGLAQQFPDSDQVFYQLGRAYAKAKDNARARKALDNALKLNPRNPFARRLLSTL
jgi:cytochrome c-type biogenesis protein CcmH/NrfG